jgi:hypothetical protein
MRATGSTRRSRGVSLLETLFALFLLTGASLLVVVLFHSGLQRSRLAYVETEARVVARDVLSDLRSKAQNGGLSGPGDLSSFETTYRHPDLPHLQVEVQAEMATLCSPSSGDESQYSDSEKRVMTESAAKVQVKVSWDDGQRHLRVISLIGESQKNLDRVEVSGAGPVAAGESAVFSAVAFDQDGQKIEDAFFVWWVDPLTATGTVIPSHDTRSAVLLNQTRTAGGTVATSVGDCRLAVLTSYDGKEVIGYSSTIGMVP